MDTAVSSGLLSVLVGGSLVLCFVVFGLSTTKHDPNEPPVVKHIIPYIGHIIGVLLHGTRYYERTSATCRLPIYTLQVIDRKIYVVTSPDMVNAINRNSKKVAFNPFVAMLGKRITDHDEATSQIVQHNLNGEQGQGYVIDVHDGTVSSLAPGELLQQTTTAMLQELSPHLDSLEEGSEINLFSWIRSTVTMCSTKAIYGPSNPFNVHPSFVNAFWDFDTNINVLMANILPWILAPKGYRARAKLSIAFQHYFEHYDPLTSQSSPMIKARYATATRYGITPANQGRLEVGTLIGILANTVPSIFYMLVHIYADPALTSDIREELRLAGFLGTPESLRQHPDLLAMPEKCPLLYSTWQELLRVHALGASSRYVLEDVVLDDQYLLKKGNIVQMPMAVMHGDTSAWGADAADFKPRRFMKQRKLASYRPFGGGAALCPGRHFVTLETLTLAACMLSRFDIAPVKGDWKIPQQAQESLATNVFPPAEDIRVRIMIAKNVQA